MALLKDPDETSLALKMQNQAQTFVDGPLQARRKRAGVLSQETAVEGQELRDISASSGWLPGAMASPVTHRATSPPH